MTLSAGSRGSDHIQLAPISRQQLLRDDVEFDDLTGLLAHILVGR